MSLISQNALVKKRGKKIKEETVQPPLPIDENVEADVVKESDVVSVKSKKRKKQVSEEQKQLDAEKEKELTNILFGSLYSRIEFGKEKLGEETKEFGGDAPLFFTDKSAGGVVTVYEGDVENRKDEDRKPAWVDDEEENQSINIATTSRLRKLRKEEEESLIRGSDYVSRLRAQHVKLNPNTEWAKSGSHRRNDEESEEEDGAVVDVDDKDVHGSDGLLRTNEELVLKSGGKLLPGHLEYSRLVDANADDPSSGPINSVQFHRNGQLLLVAGLDRRMRFFQIDGKRNTKIQSIFLEDCPIRKASFLPDGSQVIVGGRRKFFYSFDLEKARVDRIGPLTGRDEKSLEFFEVSPDSNTIAFVGNEGYILLVSCKTKELIGTLKMNGTVRSLAFADNGQTLLSFGGDGHIYHWDLRTRTCFHKVVDEGCINGSALCTSPNGGIVAAGSGPGIVNVYNREELLGGKKKPMKVIANLTTKVDFMKFNHDAQILAICSTMAKNSLKLLHVPSFTVFSNWPPPNRTLHYPRCLDFSPGGGFVATGNAAGKIYINMSYNLDPDGCRDYLSNGKTVFPKIYFLFFLSYFTMGGSWVYVLYKKRMTVYHNHFFMLAVVILKALNLLCEAEDKSYIKRIGISHGWDVLFYILSFLKGITLFTLIVLIGTGWPFLKPYLQDKEKKVLMMVIPLQVIANIAQVAIDESGPYAEDWITWKQIFLLVDVVCCCAVLFSIVWSIKSLREAAQTDGKAAVNLMKLTLFRQCHIVVICYIYFMQVVVYALETITSYQYIWTSVVAGELATLAF